MQWDTVVESHKVYSYFNFLETPWGQYQVDVTPEGKIYIPTSGFWLNNSKETLIGLIEDKVHEVDETAKTEYISKLSVFVIEMRDPDAAKAMVNEVKDVVLQFMETKM